MKTLYEVLEVSENASNEIIEKAYKVLAKKYHPDLQAEADKPEAEKKMKEINEAYSVLSDEQKRREYDAKLDLERQEERNTQYNTYEQEQTHNQQQGAGAAAEEARRQEEWAYQQETMRKQQEAEQQIRQNVQAQYEQKYQQAYEGYLRSLGYKIKYKWTWKRFKDLAITILIFVAICLVLWFLPPTHKWIVEFYESNPIVKAVVDVIGNILKGIWNGICSFFNKSIE